MTAINIFRKKASVSMLVDGAGYDALGIYRQPVLKCIPIPHLRAAVATRGSEAATPLFASLLARFTSFDQALAEGAELIEDNFDDIQSVLKRSPEAECQIFLAGWSESKNAPESYVLTSFFNPAQGLEPWEFHPLEEASAAPLPSPSAIAAAGLAITSVERFNPVIDGVKLMEAQRATRVHVTADERGDELCLVGAFAMLTTITAAGVEQRVIHRWADKIGERMNVTTANLNRHQRRMARKRAA